MGLPGWRSRSSHRSPVSSPAHQNGPPSSEPTPHTASSGPSRRVDATSSVSAEGSSPPRASSPASSSLPPALVQWKGPAAPSEVVSAGPSLVSSANLAIQPDEFPSAGVEDNAPPSLPGTVPSNTISLAGSGSESPPNQKRRHMSMWSFSIHSLKTWISAADGLFRPARWTIGNFRVGFSFRILAAASVYSSKHGPLLPDAAQLATDPARNCGAKRSIAVPKLSLHSDIAPTPFVATITSGIAGQYRWNCRSLDMKPNPNPCPETFMLTKILSSSRCQ
mmetsp:Transcript_3202/g.6635  ORF Transcript_3202/g.6635 Transcript_3202/m.6635 type:complete len:278 (-) Transcript_3202:351-1184(-)